MLGRSVGTFLSNGLLSDETDMSFGSYSLAEENTGVYSSEEMVKMAFTNVVIGLDSTDRFVLRFVYRSSFCTTYSHESGVV